MDDDGPQPGPAGLTDADLSLLERHCRAAWANHAVWHANPERFLDDPGAAAALAVLQEHGLDPHRLLALLTHARDQFDAGPDAVMCAVCLELLPGAGAMPELRDVATGLFNLAPRPCRPLALRVIACLHDAPPPVLRLLVERVYPFWALDEVAGPPLAGLVANLMDRGDRVDHRAALATGQTDTGERLGVRLLDALADALDGPHAAELRAVAGRAAVEAAAGGYLRVRDADTGDDPVTWPELDALADEIAAALHRDPPTSVLIAGAPGSGRTTLARLVARRLADRGFVLLDGRPDDIVAGQSYVNELEGRLKDLERACAGRRVAWMAEGFDDALVTARSSSDRRSLADRLVPLVRHGAPAVVAEISDDSLVALPRESPALAGAVRVAHVPAAPPAALRAIARAAVAREAARLERRVETGDRMLDLTVTLARQLLGHLALPGAAVRLATAAARAAAARGAATRLTGDDLYAGLTALTGMPRRMLDEAERLDLDEAYAWFSGRVLGQPDAVDALVERIALLKAGLADPNRPYGALLFVGPTGTGKTELARALAEYLFGSPERMVRVDMSELKTPDSLGRLVGARGAHGGESLASRVRAEPFCVVLLDEFEKAHREVWDLFLQVLDAGRLTDEAGRTADFRQTIVIVTSNIGSALRSGPGLGFAGDAAAEGFRPERVERAVRDQLRPELVNRFDRLVVFRPLGREVMRGIVELEVDAALRRRGLAMRDWAIEVDPQAFEFLLDVGFTPAMGARALRRAVERHLLVPIAKAIVAHAAPRGEQFLLVTAGDDRLDVAFVAADDAPEPEEPPGDDPAGEGLTVRAVARDARGTRAELRVLHAELEELRQAAAADAWRDAKDAALAAMTEPGFWDRPDRVEVLAAAETRDRIEHQLRGGRSLLDRLFALAKDDDVRIAAAPVARLARDLLTLRHAVATAQAGERNDAAVVIAADDGAPELVADLRAMYEGWARTAGASSRAVRVADDGRRVELVVEGLGAARALAGEAGLHVLERGRGGRARRVAAARVGVWPWTAAPGEDPQAAGLDPPSGPIVRRYQREPGPLARGPGWRTGRLDRVLAGDFDLYGAPGA